MCVRGRCRRTVSFSTYSAHLTLAIVGSRRGVMCAWAGINVQGSDQDSVSGPGSDYQGPINNMIVVARNQVHGAGVLVSGHTHNVLVDANRITNAPVGADVWQKDVDLGHVKHALVLNMTQ